MAYQLHEILLYWNLLPSAHFGLVETSTDGHLSMTYIYHLQMNVQLLVEKLELLLGLRVHEVRSKGVLRGCNVAMSKIIKTYREIIKHSF